MFYISINYYYIQLKCIYFNRFSMSPLNEDLVFLFFFFSLICWIFGESMALVTNAEMADQLIRSLWRGGFSKWECFWIFFFLRWRAMKNNRMIGFDRTDIKCSKFCSTIPFEDISHACEKKTKCTDKSTYS